MQYEYVFDPQKMHSIIFEHRTVQYSLKEGGQVEIVLAMSVSEKYNGKLTRSESTTAAFSFKTNADGEYPLQIDRIRHGPSGKFILSIWNSTNASQKAEIGIISDYVTRNPYYEDLIYRETGYQGSVKAPMISRLDNYTPPVLTHTVINHTFDQAGLPDNFITTSDVHIPSGRYIEIKEFQYSLIHQVPDKVAWAFQMNVAPKSLAPTKDGKFFEVEIDQVGTISLELNRITFLKAGASEDELIDRPFDKPITLDQFFTTNFTAQSLLSVSAHVNGAIIIRYAGKEFQSLYDNTKKISFVNFGTGFLQGTIEEDNDHREAVRLDNMKLTYNK